MYNNFTFEYPYFLLLIVLFIICSIYCKAKTPTYLIPHLNIFKFANQKSMIFINSLKYLVIIFSILALASPVKINDTILLKNDGVNILLNLDASGSMKERDLDENYSKNRFEVVKDIVKDFMDKEVERGNFEKVRLNDDDVLYKSKNPKFLSNIKSVTLEID